VTKREKLIAAAKRAELPLVDSLWERGEFTRGVYARCTIYSDARMYSVRAKYDSVLRNLTDLEVGALRLALAQEFGVSVDNVRPNARVDLCVFHRAPTR